LPINDTELKLIAAAIIGEKQPDVPGKTVAGRGFDIAHEVTPIPVINQNEHVVIIINAILATLKP